jgi:hypothetical protein
MPEPSNTELENTVPERSDLDRLIAGHLDRSLSDAEAAELAARLAHDDAAATRLAEAALLHSRLRELLAAEAPQDEVVEAVPAAGVAGSRLTRRSLAWAAGVVAMAVLVMLRLVPLPASAAGVALDRLIAAAEQATVRQYRIHVLDWDVPETAEVEADQRPRRGRKPDVGGALVTVRGPDAFVLQRQFEDGSVFLTGSDGDVGWSVPPKGPVHASRDSKRFRRGLPGERDGIPFIAFSEGLAGLRKGYALTVSVETNSDAASDVAGLQRLTAVRQKQGQRGPSRVDLWFDESGVPQRIRLEGLPRDNGNPEDLEAAVERTVEFELVGTPEVSDDFFNYASHHDGEREVRWE